jgi:tripartite ATP-independent transporter DctM subunit
MDPGLAGALAIAAVLVLVALHVPIGIAMGLAGVAGFAALQGWKPALALLSNEFAGSLSSVDLAVIPLFLLMGSLANAAGLSTDVYRLAQAFLGHRRGGLAMATVGGCAGFGSVCGSSIATAATFGRVSLPEMLARGYAPGFATGCIAAGATLGILVPPSVIMVIYAVLTEQLILDLFIAAALPSVLAIAMYLAAVAVQVRTHPESAPAGVRTGWPERWSEVRRNWRIVALAGIVLGGMYGGVFTVPEGAAVGVVLAFAFAVVRRGWQPRDFVSVLAEASATTAMIYVMILGAFVFSYFLALTKLPATIVEAIVASGIPGPMVIALILVLYIVLGAVFDEVAAMVLTLPVVLPIVTQLGYDPIWWGIVNVVVIEIGMICPPIGINVFVLNAMAKDVPLGAIYRGIVPFLAADLLRLAAIVFFPPLSLWLVHLSKGM